MTHHLLLNYYLAFAFPLLSCIFYHKSIFYYTNYHGLQSIPYSRGISFIKFVIFLIIFRLNSVLHWIRLS